MCHRAAPEQVQRFPSEAASLRAELSPHQRDLLASLTAFGRTGKSCRNTKDLETKHAASNPAARALLYQYSSP